MRNVLKAGVTVRRSGVEFYKIVFFGLTLSLISPSLSAEVIHLRTGLSVEGRILRQNADSIDLETPQGIFTVFKKDVLSVDYEPVASSQKAQQAEAQRKVENALRAEREGIQKEDLPDAERIRRLREFDDRVAAEKKKAALDRAARAAALRDLVSAGQMEKPFTEPISYMDFAWRSAVVPGWGHLAMDRPIFGSIYLGATVLLLADFVHQRSVVSTARKENTRQVDMNSILLLQPQLPFSAVQRDVLAFLANDHAGARYEGKINRHNLSLYALQILYFGQLAHVIWNGMDWENGVLVSDSRREGDFGAIVLVALDSRLEGSVLSRGALQFGLIYSF